MNTWKKLGEVGVDAGLIWIGDPCYILHKEDDDKLSPDLGKDWADFCDRLGKRETNDLHGVAQWGFTEGGNGMGITTGTGWGDGTYAVHGLIDEREGRVMAVVVVFDEETFNKAGLPEMKDSDEDDDPYHRMANEDEDDDDDDDDDD